MDNIKIKKRMLFCVAAWIIFLLTTLFVPEGSRLIYAGIVTFAFAVLLLSNFLQLKGYDFTGAAGPKQQAKPVCTEKSFNYKLLMELTALVSRNDQEVCKEVEDATLDFGRYISYYRSDEWLSDNFSIEKYRQRWYPNTDVDPQFLYDYIEDPPVFCCLNMLLWLADRGHAVVVRNKADHDYFLKAFGVFFQKWEIPIDLEHIGLLPDDMEVNRIYPSENLNILIQSLLRAGYYPLRMDAGGDDYIAVLSVDEYEKFTQMDISSLSGYLNIELVHNF